MLLAHPQTYLHMIETPFNVTGLQEEKYLQGQTLTKNLKTDWKTCNDSLNIQMKQDNNIERLFLITVFYV